MSRTVGIIAGNGVLPIEIAQAVVAEGDRPFIVGIDDEAGGGIATYDHERLDWGRFGNLFKLLEREGARDVIFVGGVSRRPNLNISRVDWTTLKALPGLLVMLMSGDDSILSGLVRMFEARGFRMVGIADVAPSMLLDAGVGKLPKKALQQAKFGAEIVRALGPFDVGQAVVVCGRRAVAVEGLEGTDAMLERVEQLRSTGRLKDERDGMLVKVPKPSQDRRVDLPAMGPKTVLNVRTAGLRGIVGEKGGMVILERERTLDLARTHGIFLHAISS